MLEACDEVGDLLQLKFSSGVAGGLEPSEYESQTKEESKQGKSIKAPRWPLVEVLKRGVEDVKGPLW